jgi:hypothetical protein
MSATRRTAIASALVVGSGLVLWVGAPLVPALFGCGLAVAVVLVREWRRPGES